MAVNSRVIVPYKVLEAAQTTQYTTPAGIYWIMDKCTCTNISAVAASVSIHRVPSGGVADTSNKTIDTKTLQPKECYTFPEVVGKILQPGDFISTIAGTAASINFELNGRMLT